MLSHAANELGDPQVRNRGTVGGACAHGDPAADYPAVMLALDATFTLTGNAGTRDVGADAFFIGMFETLLDPREVLTSIAFAAAPHSAYAKFKHPASGYAVVGAAVNLTLAGDRIAAARVALTGVGDAAFRDAGVEAALRGVAAGDAAELDAACRDAAAGIDVRGRRLRAGRVPGGDGRRVHPAGGRRRAATPLSAGFGSNEHNHLRLGSDDNGGNMATDFRSGKDFPRRGRERLGDFYWLARVFDKARAKRDDTIFDYIYPCPLDRGVFERWGITSADFDEALKTIDTDEASWPGRRRASPMRSAKRPIRGSSSRRRRASTNKTPKKASSRPKRFSSGAVRAWRQGR